MRRSSIFIAALPLTFALYAGCTQNFDQFQATQAAGSGGSATAASTGAGASSSSKSSASSSTGGGSTGTSTSSASTGGGSTSTSSSSASAGGGSTSTSSSSASSTSTSSSSSSASSASSSSSSGGLCNTPDCSNPDCAAEVVCIPSAPPGWNGPAFLYDGAPSGAPSCPASEPTTAFNGNAGLSSQPAQCGQCACSAPTVTCTPNTLDFSGNAGCSNTTGMAGQAAGGACVPILPPGGTKGYSAAAPTAIAGGCTPSGGGATLPPPDWSRTGLACSGGTLATGCSAGQVCAPIPQAPFVSGACVWRSGDLACPAGFGDKHSFASSVIDTRSCSPCECGAGAGTCTGTTTVFTDALCTSSTTFTVPNDGSCNAPGMTGGSIEVTTMGSGSCPPTGGQPTGSIMEGPTTTTVCCVP